MENQMKIKDGSLKRYLKDLGYTDREARRSIDKLKSMPPELKRAFALYFNEGIYPEMKIAGITFEELTSVMNMNPATAFLYLDWLGRDPDAALDTLLHTTSMDNLDISQTAGRWLAKDEESEDCPDY